MPSESIPTGKENIPSQVEQVAKDALSKLSKQDWNNFLHTVEVLIGTGRAEYEIEQAKKGEYPPFENK